MSNYPAFETEIDNDDGSVTMLVSVTVKVYDVTHAAALADTASDANGHVAGASVAVAVGTLLRFSYSRADGVCGYAEVLTT
jgi:hypothetical protein